MASIRLGSGALAALLLVGACAPAAIPLAVSAPVAAAQECRTPAARLHFDFEGASASACAVIGGADFALLITPEHAPPINPSPWYAFGYETSSDAPVRVTLRYLGGEHRYAPKWSSGDGVWRDLPSEPAADGKGAVIRLPQGKGIIAAQEILTPADARADLARWSAATGASVFTLGRSHDGRPIEAIRLGRADAPRLLIIVGRQHPPEVTGAMALEAFVDALVERAQGFGDLQVLVVPMLNPDGAVRGHWRANRGGIDLNRDWGGFTQPETRAVKAWLDALPAAVKPVVMLDFHSTHTNLVYVQSEAQMDAAQRRFLADWLEGQEQAVPGYPFTLEPRDANPGSGTTKNWFHRTYGIPAYTYEVADTADRPATRAAARMLAGRLLEVLKAGK